MHHHIPHTFYVCKGYTRRRYIFASYSASKIDAYRIAKVLQEYGYVSLTRGKDHFLLGKPHDQYYSVTAKGRLFFEQHARERQASTRGFAAMWFDATMDDAWDRAISPAISAAGYDPVRVDRLEHVNRIDDEILLQIDRAKFVVADFTGHRSGVYFEAGYALGKGIPVVWTCRSDDISKLHFDIRQYNSIAWSSLEDLRKRLSHRVQATVGAGPRKPLGSEFDDLLG